MALRVLWELLSADTALTFRDLQSAAGTNPSVLNARLKELREARLITWDEDGYRLTDAGRSLSSQYDSIAPMGGDVGDKLEPERAVS